MMLRQRVYVQGDFGWLYGSQVLLCKICYGCLLMSLHAIEVLLGVVVLSDATLAEIFGYRLPWWLC